MTVMIDGNCKFQVKLNCCTPLVVITDIAGKSNIKT